MRRELTALILFVAFVFDQGRTRGAEGADSTYIACCFCIRPGVRRELTALILFAACVFDQGRTRGAEGVDITYIVCCICI